MLNRKNKFLIGTNEKLTSLFGKASIVGVTKINRLR